MHGQSTSTIVDTAYGGLQGTCERGVRIFRGVPYAQPPVGDLRFRAPQPLRAWSGVRDAAVSGPASYQMNLDKEAKVLALAAEMHPGAPGIPNWPAYVGKTYNHPTVGEDCLYLDIWVPDGADGKLPVYIYYHGGANAVSSGSFPLERGATLAAQENIVAVRPNYRLGALGWVHFGLITEALPEAVNLGFLDQIAILKWVHANIAAFGGDPDNITIGGESCGATAVSQLMTHAPARPYFKRAILQSLSPFNVWCTQEKPDAIAIAEKYLRLLRVDDPAALMTIDPDRLLAVQSVLTRYLDPDDHVAWRPLGGVVDGTLIPRLPAEFLATAPYPVRDFELMIGFAKDEWQFFRGHAETIRNGSRADALRVLAQSFGPQGAETVYEAYRGIHPDHTRPGHVLSDIMSFEYFKFSSLMIAKNFAAQNIPTFVFQFAFDLPGLGGELRAVHTGDMPFLWRNFTPEDLEMWPSFDGIDVGALARTSDDMGKLYASFIRSGMPGPAWKAYDAEDEAVLSFGPDVICVDRLMTSEWNAFTGAGPRDLRTLETVLADNARRAAARQDATLP